MRALRRGRAPPEMSRDWPGQPVHGAISIHGSFSRLFGKKKKTTKKFLTPFVFFRESCLWLSATCWRWARTASRTLGRQQLRGARGTGIQ